MKPHKASKAKWEMLVLGTVSIGVALALLGLALPNYFMAKRNWIAFSSSDLSDDVDLLFLVALLIAAFCVVTALVVFRNQKFLRDASPGTVAPDQAVCAECGGIFNVQKMITHQGHHVCARCKPIFLQKLAEGAKLG